MLCYIILYYNILYCMNPARSGAVSWRLPLSPVASPAVILQTCMDIRTIMIYVYIYIYIDYVYIYICIYTHNTYIYIYIYIYIHRALQPHRTVTGAGAACHYLPRTNSGRTTRPPHRGGREFQRVH